jgi:hypothetical protein
MDGKLSEVVNQVVTNKEQVEGRVSRLECHVKEVKSDLCNQMKSWQNEARDQLGTEVQQLDSQTKLISNGLTLNADYQNVWR